MSANSRAFSATPPVVALRGISKSYGGVHAVQDLNFEIARGSIHALVGENGAGKSTLVKTLTGVIQPDEGELVIEGVAQKLSDPYMARELGIVAMYQEPTVFPDLTVAENIFASKRPGSRFAVDWKAMRRRAATILDELGVEFGPSTPVRALSVADRQLLEIAKALSTQARLLIMDEPTAVLSPREVESLFARVRPLQERGVTIVFISHRLEEVTAIADTVTVLRDGMHVTTRPAAGLSHGEIVSLIVGRNIDAYFPKEDAHIGDVVFSARGLARDGVFSDVSFELRSGEIVGLAGFVGAGRTEVARSIFGVDPLDDGEVEIEGEAFKPRSPRSALSRGLAYLPEDRLNQGLILPMPIGHNISMAVLAQLTPGGVLRPRRERKLAEEFMRLFRVRAGSPAQAVNTLSGGNQQKVVLAKWLATKPRVLILDEPTHGVDVGTKAEIHRTISHLASEGLAILLISSELPEILGMSDRVLVMCEGRLVAGFPRAEATEQRIIQAAAQLQEEAVA